MKDLPLKISVIIVCKNERDTVEKSIESVISQSYKNFEIIVLDGNSTDGTLDELKKYQDKIKLIIGKENGIYNAMNDGIDLATGEILYFLNANDSLFSNDVFETVIKYFEKGKYDLIFCDTMFQGREGSTFVTHEDFYSRFVWAYRNINHQSTFYKKWLFEKYGKYKQDEFKILADVEFTTHAITQKDVKHLYLPIIVANYNNLGISSYDNPQNIAIARKEKAIIAKTYLNFEYNMFKIYNFFFNNFITTKFNEWIKKTYGLKTLFKIRDFKRILGRFFIWKTRKI